MDQFIHFVILLLKSRKCKATVHGCKMMHILPPLYDFSSALKPHFFNFYRILGLHTVGLSAKKSVMNRRTDTRNIS